jgi:hypothetical protein
MAKMTKAQQKRAVKAIYSKVEKLYFASDSKITLKELEAQRKMCNKWLRLLSN